MKKLIYILPSVLIIFAFWVSCKKEGRIDHINMKAPTPGQVSNIQVLSTPGGAILTYNIPEDPNFYYAEADYEIQPGVTRQAKASYYIDTLELVGYGDTLSHKVKIYSVGLNGKKSDPLSITVSPLTPPVRSVFKTLSLQATFGGVQVGFKDSAKANIAIVVMEDTTGMATWSTIRTFYTGAKEGTFTIRGLDTTKQEFAVFIRDRWGNKSDTLFKFIKPLFEEEIQKNTWKVVPLASDQEEGASAKYKLKNLFDEVNTSYTGVWASSNSSTLPQSFTIDLGEEVVISRIVEHQAQPASHFYNGSAVKEFQLWASNNPGDDWSNWDSLGTFQSFKPSGLPLGQTNSDDVQYAYVQGENFTFDYILPAYRYIRWKTLETYSSAGQVVIGEIDVWGRIVH